MARQNIETETTSRQSVTLSAPSRLHFGLYSVGSPATSLPTNSSALIADPTIIADQPSRQFGGIGLMVEQPRTTIEVSSAPQLTLVGPESETCRVAITRWFNSYRQPLNESINESINDSISQTAALTSVEQLPLKLVIQSSPPRHCGLGSGTQLALTVATAAMKFLKLPPPNPGDLAAAVGRGKRSAIGTYGFFQGGFLADRGKQNPHELAPLDFQTTFPEHWPIVLVRHRGQAGLSGGTETTAFQNLPAVSAQQRAAMIDLVRGQILPGIMRQNYEEFADAIYQFGRQSGMFFQSIQGGPYNGPEITQLVNQIRDFGVKAVGQTSWGPCVFAIAGHDKQANQLKSELLHQYHDRLEVLITHADNRGVQSVTHGELSPLKT